MSAEMEFLSIKKRIAALEGQKSGAEAELIALKQIKCPFCVGTGNIPKKPVEGADAGVYYETCKMCDGSGKISDSRY